MSGACCDKNTVQSLPNYNIELEFDTGGISSSFVQLWNSSRTHPEAAQKARHDH
jgi:hypothetical protein